MPHKNSGGKPAPQAAARPAPARKPPPQPVNRAPPPAPVQSSGSGGSLLGNIVQGMAYGAGNAMAQRTIDAVLGPRTIQHETVDPAPAASNMVLKILGYGIEALKYVMSETETPNSKKQSNSSHNNERSAPQGRGKGRSDGTSNGQKWATNGRRSKPHSGKPSHKGTS
ncbi:uncharacterized protein LOC110647626 isoform X2 [Hevea brasiliensis]|uniref:uncharacterized protein LOC110647626 isoform X2 n=1 Tax=Hevea brasiliensis TaxID=3981 RepID=UPI0025E521E9|nr:uncharacterized protein LOC110647626 isoform X2 [Hevea brasiliensis]